eukprot:CAMPEP_0168589320 /NCGR_PEP_ID=MMETSP0420-20121227/5950_1 /TAXON_ID=498008 /ORGANISM="Pessonella sp." /LENGTH=659 /DNA_ID=CAMNT_0008624861 /DNA_START=162 /DNA_END=2141 /DNA_ORIENTATION=-
MLICACEFMFWFAPVAYATSDVAVTQQDRVGAMAFYEGSLQLGATDIAMRIQGQRQLLEYSANAAREQLREEFEAQNAHANSARKGGVSLLGGLMIAGGALLMSAGRGSGLAAARDRSGGGDAASHQRNGGEKRAKKASLRDTARSVDVAATAVGAGAVVAGAAVFAVGARRGLGASTLRAVSSVTRSFSTKPMAPAAEAVQRSSSSSSSAAGKNKLDTSAAEHARYELVPPESAARVAPQRDAPKGEALRALDDAALVELIRAGSLPPHSLEAVLGDNLRAVRVRRESLGVGAALEQLPFEHYDYEQVVGACAENVLGYVPVPVGVAGPVLMDGRMVHIPMATTEGCLIASTHRGCKAITESGGATSVLLRDGMTRAPAVRLPSAARAGAMVHWLQQAENIATLRAAFESTTRFGKLLDVKPHIAGRTVYVRFLASTGDAMGMNMISKGVEKALDALQEAFDDAEIMALSGNVCTDKKPSAINWVNGRGKSVVAECVITKDVVRRVLKTTVDDLVELNVSKNLVGSAVAGSVGGFNAHASNIVTAVYLATGQDPAQNVESSNCITLMERDGEDLRVSVTMPSIECATVGGGTQLKPQAAALKLMNCQGASQDEPGSNARAFARSVAVATLAGELSLMSALASGALVKSHMALNRKASK